MSFAPLTSTKGQHGLSLIEFLIAILLGTILIGGAVSIYLASSRSYTEAEKSISLGNSARFSLQVITDSLRHVGFMAGIQGADITQDVNLGAVAGDCNGRCAAYDLSNFLFAMRFTDGDADPFGIIDDAWDPNGIGTDILVVKYLLPDPLYDADPNDPAAVRNGTIDFPVPMDDETTYVIANSELGMLIDGADPHPDVRNGQAMARGQAWPYSFQVYYVGQRDEDTPVLARKVLRWDAGAGSMAVVTEELIEGVENLRFRFGFDTDADGEIDTYRDLGGGVNPNLWDWSSVGFAEAFVLVRSLNKDANYVDEKTYTMADLTYTPVDDSDPDEDPDAEQYNRLMVSSPITLRNRLFFIRGGQ